MTPDFFIVSIKPCSVVGNDKHITLCNFYGLSMIGTEVIEGSLRDPLPVTRSTPLCQGQNWGLYEPERDAA